MFLYEKYLGCFGGCLGSFCCTCQKVQTGSIGLLERFGKFSRTIKPGVFFVNPCTERLHSVSLMSTYMSLDQQPVYTKDNISLDMDVCLIYRIVDPYSATYRVQDIVASLTQLTFVTMKTVCGQNTMQDILVKRDEIKSKIQNFVRDKAQQWGVYVEHLLLKDLKIPGYLQDSLSQVSKTRRTVEASIISAKADLESAQLYRKAADAIDIKAAIQIRFLETLDEIDEYKSQKLIILPLDVNGLAPEAGKPSRQ